MPHYVQVFFDSNFNFKAVSVFHEIAPNLTKILILKVHTNWREIDQLFLLYTCYGRDVKNLFFFFFFSFGIIQFSEAFFLVTRIDNRFSV